MFAARHVGTARLDTLDTSRRDEPSGIWAYYDPQSGADSPIQPDTSRSCRTCTSVFHGVLVYCGYDLKIDNFGRLLKIKLFQQ